VGLRTRRLRGKIKGLQLAKLLNGLTVALTDESANRRDSANVIAALRLAEQLGSGAVVVSVMVDTGMKYLKAFGARLSANRAVIPPRGYGPAIVLACLQSIGTCLPMRN
jgi:aconitase B